MCSLFDEPRTTFHGDHYRLTDAPAAPKPLQPHLPLLIGGGGERRTMHIAAPYADTWEHLRFAGINGSQGCAAASVLR